MRYSIQRLCSISDSCSEPIFFAREIWSTNEDNNYRPTHYGPIREYPRRSGLNVCSCRRTHTYNTSVFLKGQYGSIFHLPCLLYNTSVYKNTLQKHVKVTFSLFEEHSRG